MAIATGYTAEHMQEIEDATIVSGSIIDGFLILVRHDGTIINAGRTASGIGSDGEGVVYNAPNPELFADSWSSDIVHFLGTESPDVTIWRESNNELTDLEIRVVSANAIQIKSSNDESEGTYRIRISGSGGERIYERDFASATNVWDFPHNFGTKALNVYTENAVGTEIRGDVSYPDENTVRVTFFHNQTGHGRVFS